MPGNALRSQGSPGEQKVHAFNLGNNGSLISREETEVAGCLLCGPQEGKVATSPFPHPCGCLSQTMNSNKRDRPKKAIRGPEKGPNPWEFSHMRPPLKAP